MSAAAEVAVGAAAVEAAAAEIAALSGGKNSLGRGRERASVHDALLEAVQVSPANSGHRSCVCACLVVSFDFNNDSTAALLVVAGCGCPVVQEGFLRGPLRQALLGAAGLPAATGEPAGRRRRSSSTSAALGGDFQLPTDEEVALDEAETAAVSAQVSALEKERAATLTGRGGREELFGGGKKMASLTVAHTL